MASAVASAPGEACATRRARQAAGLSARATSSSSGNTGRSATDAFAMNREAPGRASHPFPESRGRARAAAPASPRAGDEAPGAGAARARFSRPRSISLSRRDIYGAAALKFVSGGARSRRRSKFRGGTSRGAPAARVKYERCPRRALMSTGGRNLPHSGTSQFVEHLWQQRRVRAARGSTSPPAAFSGCRADPVGASGPRARGRPAGLDPDLARGAGAIGYSHGPVALDPPGRDARVVLPGAPEREGAAGAARARVEGERVALASE